LRSFVFEFRSHHGNTARRVNAQPHLATFQADNCHADILSDVNLLHQLPREHKHRKPSHEAENTLGDAASQAPNITDLDVLGPDNRRLVHIWTTARFLELGYRAVIWFALENPL
jgi:hypothetical protein